MTGRTYRRIRAGNQHVPGYSEFLAAALIDGVELLLNTSGIADAGGNLDVAAARAAWIAHREKVIDYAAKNRPGQKVWALNFDNQKESAT